MLTGCWSSLEKIRIHILWPFYLGHLYFYYYIINFFYIPGTISHQYEIFANFFHFGGSLTLSCLLTYENYIYIWSVNGLAFCLLYYSCFCYHMEESFAKDHKENLLKNLFIRVISQLGKYNWYLTISWIPSTMSGTW